ncbi:hypothetical protein [Azovibrio restrictus]|uniref:DUF7931 domain-containing protein n=1 Tax=Azovibrio restrictus TaxID=146938 RepID=UPI0026EA3D43|nr:hypothetical protein [Azovibrio restrictus]MDD3484398.1 hypothetical protein [Azovibrio restrictus]
MPTQIHSTWGEFRASFEQVLAHTRHSLCIFDADLEQLGLDQAIRFEQLRQLLASDPATSIRIALKTTEHLHRQHPRLIQLLQTHGHAVHVQQIPDSLLQLRDTLIIGDQEHALVRFDQDHPRAKLIIADKKESSPYLQRFEDIWQEGGTPFTPTPLGL